MAIQKHHRPNHFRTINLRFYYTLRILSGAPHNLANPDLNEQDGEDNDMTQLTEINFKSTGGFKVA